MGRFWVLTVVLALAAIGGPLRAGHSAPSPNCAPVELLLMSYNIRLDVASDGDNAWPMRRDFLIGQVAMMRPDVIGLQEVMPSQMLDMAAAMPQYVFIGGGRDDGSVMGEAAPLAVDGRVFAVGESGMFWLSTTPNVPSLGWDAAYKRVVSWARVTHRGSGRKALLLNTHWDHVGAQARRESGRMIADWIAANRQPGEAVVLLGDMNIGVSDDAFAPLLYGGEKGGLLHDAAVLSATAPFGPKGSFNGFAPMAQDDTRIDHILVSDTMQVARFAVWAQNDGVRVPSDHFAVVALVRWGDDAAAAQDCE